MPGLARRLDRLEAAVKPAELPRLCVWLERGVYRHGQEIITAAQVDELRRRFDVVTVEIVHSPQLDPE